MSPAPSSSRPGPKPVLEVLLARTSGVDEGREKAGIASDSEASFGSLLNRPDHGDRRRDLGDTQSDQERCPSDRMVRRPVGEFPR